MARCVCVLCCRRIVRLTHRTPHPLTDLLGLMAESTGTPLPSSRYFCHQCDQNITPLPVSWARLPHHLISPHEQEFTCPRCLSGFVEELEAPAADQAAPAAEPRDANAGRTVNLTSLLENLYGRIDPNHRSQESAAGRSDWAASAAPMFRVNFPVGATGTSFDTSHALEGIIQQILSNVASGALHPTRDPRNPASGRTAGQAEFPLPLFQVLHGNPGDYVWGSGGLDTVITQLLNNLDGSGPPPLNQKEIALIPTVEVTADDVAKNTQCSVCMEDFRLKEPVRKLPCSHLYHTDCIVPWLQMHGTCPICRKTISVNSPSEPTASTPPAPSGSSSGYYFDLNDYD